MKTIKLIIIIVLSITNQLYAQDIPNKNTEDNTKGIKVKNKKTDNTNILDMQANLFSGLLGEDIDAKSSGKPVGFLDLLEEANLPPELKKEYQNNYYLQSRELSQKQKDSISKEFEKKIKEAQKNQKTNKK